MSRELAKAACKKILEENGLKYTTHLEQDVLSVSEYLEKVIQNQDDDGSKVKLKQTFHSVLSELKANSEQAEDLLTKVYADNGYPMGMYIACYLLYEAKEEYFKNQAAATQPEVRTVIAADVNLSSGEGLEGGSPFVSGSALFLKDMHPRDTQIAKMEHKIFIKQDTNIQYVANFTHHQVHLCIAPEVVKPVFIGSLYGSKQNDGKIDIQVDVGDPGSEHKPEKVKIIFTGTDCMHPNPLDTRDFIEPNSYDALDGVLDLQKRAEILVKSYNGGLIEAQYKYNDNEGVAKVIDIVGDTLGFEAVV